MHNDNNWQTNILVKLEKKLQTNIAMNGLYDTKLCGSNTV